MTFLSKILNKKATGRLFGQLAPYSISLDNSILSWEKSSVLEAVAKAKVNNLDTILILPNNKTTGGVFIRIFVYEKQLENEDLHLTFDITKAKDLQSEVLSVGSMKFPASRVSGIEEFGLENDKYHENVLVNTQAFEVLFDLFISNNDGNLKQAVIKDFLEIINSLKVN